MTNKTTLPQLVQIYTGRLLTARRAYTKAVEALQEFLQNSIGGIESPHRICPAILAEKQADVASTLRKWREIKAQVDAYTEAKEVCENSRQIHLTQTCLRGMETT